MVCNDPYDDVCDDKVSVISYGADDDEYLSDLLLHLSDETQPDKRIRIDDGWRAVITTGGMSRSPNMRAHIGRYLAAEAKAVEEADLTVTIAAEDDCSDTGMKLLQCLVSCSEAVACRDRAHATALLTELGTLALVFGTSFQRVASCFVQGLANRLESLQPLGAVGFKGPTKHNGTTCTTFLDDKREETLGIVYDICPYISFGHYVANSAILEAFERESYVHVVDLGMTLGLPRGHQWRRLIHSLANRPEGPPRQLRITAVGLRGGSFRAIGDGLREYANGLCVNLKFSVVESCLEELRGEDIVSFEGEVLVVNSVLQLHRVVKESRGALNSVLKVVHELGPKVLVLVEQDSSHNGPFFLGRFMEALHYYAAIFDSLDAVLPKYDTKRAKVEQFYFGEEIKNIVSCEGPARVERHERVDQWRRRMSRAGFQASPIKMVARAKKWLGKNTVCEGYTVSEEKGCLVLGWKSRPIIAASCWKC